MEANAEPFVIKEKNEKLLIMHGAIHGFVKDTRNLLALNESMHSFGKKTVKPENSLRNYQQCRVKYMEHIVVQLMYVRFISQN